MKQKFIYAIVSKKGDTVAYTETREIAREYKKDFNGSKIVQFAPAKEVR